MLKVRLDLVEGVPNEDCFGPAAFTARGLTALSCALEMNTTLRALEFTPTSPIARLREDIDLSNEAGNSDDESELINAHVNAAVLRNIDKELALNADPQKCASIL